MKNITSYILTCLAVAALTACDKRPKMPVFDILLKDSTTVISTKSIPKDKPVMIFYFSPDCDHCQKETSDILKHIDEFRGLRIYFITSDDFSRIKVYDHHYKMYNYPQITLGRDFRNSFAKAYDVASPPYSVIYDKHKRIQAVFAGEASAKEMIAHIN